MWTSIAIIAIISLYVICIYNNLIALRNQSHEAAATIDTQLKRRYDLIPNLVETVRAAANHEKQTLNAVISARNMAMNATGPERVSAENNLTQTLKTLFANVENYPTLRANENFLELQHELSDTETKIQSARQFYNTVVMRLNTKIEQFPSNIVANLFSIKQETLFEITESERTTPQVKF
ncbi:MAG: LemA family protein [Alphaproteobacteria bacterium]|nr:LemA family protein [Alphaproteobacteria bacterium]